MPTAEKRVRVDPTKCMVCQGSLGLHPMKVKVEGRIGRLCNRVDKQHADWLLDRKMDTAYLRITYRRRGGLLGIIVLMLAFISLLWIFSYTTDFKGPIVAAATFVSIVIGAFLIIEFRTITVGDRMRRMLTEAELERPIVYQKPSAALESMDELARHTEAEPPMPDPFATDLAPAPTRSSPQRVTMTAEDGIPGIPQPVVAAKEWEVMAGEEEAPPAPAGTPLPAAQPAPGTPVPQTPPLAMIEDLPDDTAPSQVPPSVAPPLAPAAPIAPAATLAPPPPPPPPQTVQAPPPPPPAAAQPAMVEELPAQADQRPPPSTALSPPAPAQAPPPQPPAAPVAPTTPAPPVPQQYQPPPAQPVQPQQQPVYQQPTAQPPPVQPPPVQPPPVQPPPVQPPAPAPPPQPAQQVAPAQPQQPPAQQPQRPKKTPQEEADEWVVDWE